MLVNMEVVGVRIEMPSNQPIVLLKEIEGSRFLPIWVGAVEATAIAFAHPAFAVFVEQHDAAVGSELRHFLVATDTFITPDVFRDFAADPAHRTDELRVGALHARDEHLEVGEVGGEISSDGSAPVADSGGVATDAHAGGFDLHDRLLELIVAHGRAGELLAIEEAELEGLPAEGLMSGNLAVDVVGGFVGEAGEGEG